MTDSPQGAAMRWIVMALGITQVIGYGTLYYSFAILAAPIGESYQATNADVFAIFSVGLLMSGLVAPRLGRLMDLHGAPRLMALGSILSAASLAALSAAPGLTLFAILFCAMEIVSVLVLYSAAFATLARFSGADARRSITHLTLIAGFASTLFWPLTGWLLAELGWRATYQVFAAMHLLMAAPLHLWVARHRAPKALDAGAAGGRTQHAPLAARHHVAAYWCIAVSFALSGALMSALNVHLVPVLQTMGLGAAAYYTSMLMGPAQVAVRLSDALFWRGLHPNLLALVSTAALFVAVLLLMIDAPALIAAVAFALVFGAGQGLSTIVAGALPLALFGADGFGERLGRLARIKTLLSAGAPFLFALALDLLGTTASLALVAVVGLSALAPLVYLEAKLLRKL